MSDSELLVGLVNIRRRVETLEEMVADIYHIVEDKTRSTSGSFESVNYHIAQSYKKIVTDYEREIKQLRARVEELEDCIACATTYLKRQKKRDAGGAETIKEGK